MDSILAEALSTTSEGQAFSADVAAGQDSQSHWLAFVTLVDGQYRSQLEDAAGGGGAPQAPPPASFTPVSGGDPGVR